MPLKATEWRDVKVEPDLQVGEIFCRHGGSHEAVKILQQVFLTRLPECEAIDGQASFEPLESSHLAAEREHGHAAFDFHRTFVDPVGNEVRVILGLGAGGVEHDLPGIIVICLAPTHHVDLPMRQIEADRVTLEPVDTPLALLEIDGISGQVPVIEPIAIRVKVEAFLSDGGRGQREGSER